MSLSFLPPVSRSCNTPNLISYFSNLLSFSFLNKFECHITLNLKSNHKTLVRIDYSTTLLISNDKVLPESHVMKALGVA